MTTTKTTTKAAPKYKVVPTSKGPAISYSPEVDGALGIVNLKVLKSLVDSMDTTSFADIKDKFIERLISAGTMDEYTAIIGEEFAFRNTLHKIRETDLHTAEIQIAQQDEIDDLTETLTEKDIVNLQY